MNAKPFFLRFDVIRKIGRALLVLLMIVLFFARSWKLGTFGIVFLSVSFVLSLICSCLKVTKEYKLSEYISKARTSFELEVLKEHKSFRRGDPVMLYAFDMEKELFARALGRRLIYPVCLDMMFLRHATGGTLIVGRLSLWKKEKRIKTKYRFEELNISIVRMEGDAEILLVTMMERGDAVLRFYVRDDHYWKSFVSYAEKNVRITEEAF